MRFVRATVLAAIIIFPGGSFPIAASPQTLKQVAKVDLPGPAGKRFDYLTIDEEDTIYCLPT